MNLIKTGGNPADLLNFQMKVVTVDGHEHLVSIRSVKWTLGSEWKHHAHLLAAEPGKMFSIRRYIDTETGATKTINWYPVVGEASQVFAGWKQVRQDEADKFMARL